MNVARARQIQASGDIADAPTRLGDRPRPVIERTYRVDDPMVVSRRELHAQSVGRPK
jgi:hypothetical protein